MNDASLIIYGLQDPRTDEIRYVGQSSSGMRRPKMHMWPSRLTEKTPKTCWIRKLNKLGQQPRIIVLDCVDQKTELDTSEVKWIAIGRLALGERLTNATLGGDGSVGLKHSTEARMKMSMSQLNSPLCAARRAAVALAQRGQKRRPRSLETRSRISASIVTVWQSTAHREKRLANKRAAT